MQKFKLRQLRELPEAEEGTIALIIVLCIFAMIVLMGGGLDFSKHRSQSVIVQAALDATAIHMVQEDDIPPGQILSRARQYFDANANGLNANITSFMANRDGDRFSVSVNADVETSFLALLSIETLPVFREAESLRTTEIREIALVLDTTSSMNGSRLADLKVAANLLLDGLQASGGNTTEHFRVGVVPFNEFVRVNPDDFPDQWLDNEGRSNAALEIFGEEVDLVELFDHLGDPWLGCVRSRPGDLAFRDDPVTAGDFDTHFTPLFSYDEGDDGSYLNNYLTDAVVHPDGISSVSSLLKYGIAPGASNDPNSWAAVSPSFEVNIGPNRNCRSTPIIPLTTDLNRVRNTIDSLVARGDTHMTEALVWGERVLSSHAPFTEGLPTGTAGNRKILIFLSDGINSIDGGNSDLRSALNAQGYAAIGEQANLLPPNPNENDINDYLDDEFIDACDAIKGTGTQIIVIRLEQNDSTSLDLLRDCATSVQDFFDVPNSSQLSGVFSELALRVTAVQLTR